MEIVLTGTGSPIPDPNRAGPSTLIKVGELEHLLIDAGRGVVMRMAGAGSFPPLLSGVLVTHLHSDHLTDLNDVITTHWVMSPGPRELKIFGPPRGSLDLLTCTLLRSSPTWATGSLITMTWTIARRWRSPRSNPVMSSSWAPRQRERLRNDPCARAPRPSGTGSNTTARSPRLRATPSPCDGLGALVADADAYVQTVIRDDLVKLVPNERMQDILDYHSSVEQAAQTASRWG